MQFFKKDKNGGRLSDNSYKIDLSNITNIVKKNKEIIRIRNLDNDYKKI